MLSSVQIAVVGYALFSYLLFALALVGIITVPVIFICLALASMSTWFLANYFKLELASQISRKERHWVFGFVALIVLLFAHVLIVPPFMVDDLVYHLYFPQQTLRMGQLYFSPYNLSSNYPMLFELPLMTFLALGLSPFMANLLTLVGVLLALYAAGREIFSIRPILLLSCLVLVSMTPAIYNLLYSAYVELFLSLVLLLALYHYLSFQKNRAYAYHWYMAAMFLGLACAVRYTALFLVFVIFVNEFFRKSDSRIFYKGVLVAAVCMAPWYIKNWIMTGNPFLPLFNWFFDSPFLSPARDHYYKAMLSNYNYGTSALDYLVLPFRLLLGWDAELKEGLSGFGGQLSVYFVLVGVGLGFRSNTKRILSILFLGIFIVWATNSQQVRLLLPFMFLMILSGLSVIDRHWERLRVFYWGLVTVTALQCSYNLFKQMDERRILPLLTGAISRDDFLRGHLSISYDFAKKVNKLEDARDYRIFSVGNFGRSFYFVPPLITNTHYDLELFDLAFDHKDPQLFVLEKFLNDEQITHIMFDWKFFEKFHEDDQLVNVEALKAYLDTHSQVVLQQDSVELRILNKPSLTR